MAHIDFKNRSITAKVVYYGCGLCGKTRNLEYINAQSKDTSELMAISTEGDRTIFFDFLPMSLGKIRGISTQFKLYAVPGQVRYNMTRKLVLRDVDGVVFVVDSQRPMLRANLDSLKNLYENLAEQGVDPASIPIVLQYNKRDLDGVMPVADLEKAVNTKGYPSFAASAFTGEGVFETLDHVCKLVFDSLWQSLGTGDASAPVATDPAGPGTPQTVSGPSPAQIQPEEEAKSPVAAESTEVFEASIETGGAHEEQSAADLPASHGQQESPAAHVAGQDLPAAEGVAPSEDAATGSEATPVQRVSIEPSAELLATTERLAELVAALERHLESGRALDAASQPQPHAPSPASPRAPAPESSEAHASTGDLEMAELRSALNEARAAQLKAERRNLELERELRQARAEIERSRKEAERTVERTQRDDATRLAAMERDLAAKSDALERSETARREAEDRLRALERMPSEPTRATQAHAPLDRVQSPPPSQEPSQAQAILPETAGPPAAVAEEDDTATPARQAAEAEADAEAFAGDKDHDNARRVARVMVSDLLLYHRDVITTAQQEGADVRVRLEEQLAEARRTYDARVPGSVREARDYLTLELDRVLAQQAARASAAASREAAQPTVELSLAAKPDGSAAPQTAQLPTETEAEPEQEASKSESQRQTEAAGDATASSAESHATEAGGDDATGESDDDEKNARRIARVMVGDLFLYHRDLIDEALKKGDALHALEEQLAEAQKTFATRVPENIRKRRDYLSVALESQLAKRVRELGLNETAPQQTSDAPAQAATKDSEPATEESKDDVGKDEPGKKKSADVDATNADPYLDNREHKNARRVARVMVADLFLYHKDLVEAGIKNGNVEQALEEQLGEARKTFASRVPESVRKERDYLSLEFERLLKKRLAQVSQAQGARDG